MSIKSVQPLCLFLPFFLLSSLSLSLSLSQDTSYSLFHFLTDAVAIDTIWFTVHLDTKPTSQVSKSRVSLEDNWRRWRLLVSLDTWEVDTVLHRSVLLGATWACLQVGKCMVNSAVVSGVSAGRQACSAPQEQCTMLGSSAHIVVGG